MTKPLIHLLLPTTKHCSDNNPETSSPKSLTAPLLSSLNGSDLEIGDQPLNRPSSIRMLLTKPSKTVHFYWRKFDNAIMRPVFGGRGFAPYVPGSPIEQSVHGGD
jgi:hypothetical protein